MSITDDQITALAIFQRNWHAQLAKTSFPSNPQARVAVQSWIETPQFLEALKTNTKEVLRLITEADKYARKEAKLGLGTMPEKKEVENA